MRSTSTRDARHRLHKRRWAIMARYPVWQDDWIKRLSDDDARQLLSVFEALRRLDRGIYGLCVNCGSPIDYERLTYQPEAANCIVCATFAAETLTQVAS
jgi:RNA polymerase-binding transcription factor DksA